MTMAFAYPAWAAAAAAVLLAAIGAASGLGARDSALCGIKVLAGTVGSWMCALLLLYALGMEMPREYPHAVEAGILAVPACIVLNLILLRFRAVRTLYIDATGLLGYAFLSAYAAQACGSASWGMAAALGCFAAVLALGDMFAPRLAKTYSGIEGLSVPDPFCLTAVPLGALAEKAMRRLWTPGNTASGEDEKKTGALVSAALAFAAGCAAAATAPDGCAGAHSILLSGLALAALTVIVPLVSALLCEAYAPAAGAVRAALQRKCNNPGALALGVGPMVLAGHRANVLAGVVSAAAIAGLARIAGIDCIFPPAAFAIAAFALPFTHGRAVQTSIVALCALALSAAFAPRPGWAPPQKPVFAETPATPAVAISSAAATPAPAAGEAAADAAAAMAREAALEAAVAASREEADECFEGYLSVKRAVSGAGAGNMRAKIAVEAADRLLAAFRKHAAAETALAVHRASGGAQERLDAGDSAEQFMRALDAVTPQARPGAAPPTDRPETSPFALAAASLPGALSICAVSALGWFGRVLAALVLLVLLYANRCEITGEARLLKRRAQPKRRKQEELFGRDPGAGAGNPME